MGFISIGNDIMNISEEYKIRFVKLSHVPELVNLYHLARTSLSGKDCSKYNRMIWASGEFARKHNYVSCTGAYKDLCGILEH